MNKNARIVSMGKFLKDGTLDSRDWQALSWHTGIGKFIAGGNSGRVAFIDSVTGILTPMGVSPIATASGPIQMQEDLRNGGIIYFTAIDIFYINAAGTVVTQDGAAFTYNLRCHFTRPGDPNDYVVADDLISSPDNWATKTTEIVNLLPFPDSRCSAISPDRSMIVTGNSNRLIALNLADDPTNILNWMIEDTVAASFEPFTCAINPANTRAVFGHDNNDVTIWDFGSPPVFLSATNNWLVDANNTSTGSEIVAVIYSPELEGFVLITDHIWFGSGFIADGSSVVQGIAKFSNAAISGDDNFGSWSGDFDRNTNEILMAAGNGLAAQRSRFNMLI